MKILNLALIVAFSFSIVSCNSDGKKSEEVTAETVDLSEILKAADAISPDLKSVDDVLKTLELANAQYFPVLCNDPYNAENYMESKAAAASNLGIYVTDIVYHVYGDATEDMYLTFGAAQELARYLGLESEFGATLLTELEGDNISRDSLINVFNNLLSKSEDLHSADDVMHVHTAFITGLYVEKLFIVSSLLDQAQKKEDPSEKEVANFKKLLVILKNQLDSMGVLEESLEKNKKQLKETIDIDAIMEMKGAVETFDGAYEGILGSETISSSKEITDLQSKIASLRTGIIATS